MLFNSLMIMSMTQMYNQERTGLCAVVEVFVRLYEHWYVFALKHHRSLVFEQEARVTRS